MAGLAQSTSAQASKREARRARAVGRRKDSGRHRHFP